MKTVTLDEFKTALKTQGVPPVNFAFICPVCGTIQSAKDLIIAGAGKDFGEIEQYLGYSCVGRWKKSGPFIEGKSIAGNGCDWTLGGLFQLHTLTVETPDGEKHQVFEPATPEQAKEHMGI